MYSSNAAVDAAVSLLKHVGGRKGRCLHQLCLSDAPLHRNTYLYRLAQQPQLARFRVIVLVASRQDGYVPLHSARMSACGSAAPPAGGGPAGEAYRGMLSSLLRGLGGPGGVQLLRIDVDFEAPDDGGFSLGGLLNDAIGRRAHIQFLESHSFAFFLVWTIHRYRLLATEDAVPWL
eukprot:351674-Chlamydomonas_euryale.AAC.1